MGRAAIITRPLFVLNRQALLLVLSLFWLQIDFSSILWRMLVDNECKYRYVILKTVTK